MNAKDRETIRLKYGGKCAYCGCELVKGWHVDHIEPIRRNDKAPPCHPERENFDNYNPACASCNINKHSLSLEEFRRMIYGFITHLNTVNTQYKIAKRYGLVRETESPVVFYFETFEKE